MQGSILIFNIHKVISFTLFFELSLQNLVHILHLIAHLNLDAKFPLVNTEYSSTKTVNREIFLCCFHL